MPYARRNFKRTRKTYRRSRKGRSRRRFARKSFSKVPRSLRAGLYIPKEAFVKLPFTQVLRSPASTFGAPWILSYNGNGITCPQTSSVSVPFPGDLYPLGLSQYAGFYKYYKVLGSSIKVNISSNATGLIQAWTSLLAAQGLNGDTDTSSNYMTMLNADPQDLISYPGCSWRILSSQSGSQSNIFLKGFRKTKTMLGRKDIRDNDDCQGLLPGTDDTYPNGSNPSSATNSGSWFWMIKIDPTENASIAEGSYQVIVKIKYYVQLYGRDFNIQVQVPQE